MYYYIKIYGKQKLVCFCCSVLFMSTLRFWKQVPFLTCFVVVKNNAVSTVQRKVV